MVVWGGSMDAVPWLLCSALLLGVALVLRRMLGLSTRESSGRISLDADREKLCQAVGLEFEAEVAILTVLLNDAIEEWASGNPEIAAGLLRLAICQWNRLAGALNLLLRVTGNYLPVARATLPVRRLAKGGFRSEKVVDCVRVHELAHRFLFRTKLRFNLHVRLLRYATEALTADFQSQPQQAAGGDPSDTAWNRLERDLHDLDLLTREVLFSLRDFVGCLPVNAARDFAAELQPVLTTGVRSVR